ncbi:cyclic nucleotide-binding and patatin-like phospholipase domain-containing protein [Stieleria mannarensis]|uniref:cyclic nucleotide-binding and patatin-like phospholipase domain-containing protein n=1 Tax=Stieleria mannarensis TaxID=2755585 RepID=UPI0016039212|nr:cyclic nucleotide-binding and patatin-like phospholipase domain-containing protein [Rhodopirellula sp. JC639]
MTLDRQRLRVELQRLDWARHLSPDVIEDIAAAAEISQFMPGDEVMATGAEITKVYFVIEGSLESILFDRLDKQIHCERLARGSVLGLFSVVLPERSHLQVSAVEPTTAIHFTLDELLRLTTKHREFQLSIFSAAANVVKRLVVVDRDLPKPAVVGVVHPSDASRSLTVDLVRRLRQLEETVCVAGDDDRWSPSEGVPFKQLYENGAMISPDAITNSLREWSSLGRLFIDVRADHPQDDLNRLLSYSEVVLWCIAPADVDAAIEQLRVLQRAAPWLRDKVRIVWCLTYDDAAPPYLPKLDELAAGDFKTYSGQSSTQHGKLLGRGLERIVHHLRGVHIGLALGGGAARGMAHLGVLKCLEQHGIFVDRLAGTSAGAMTGTVYAAGMDPDYATQCFKTDLMPGWFFRRLPAGGYWYLIYKYRYDQFDPMLRKYLHDFRMEQLAIPMTTIAVDLVEGALLERHCGDATHNILESINLPPLALPIVKQGQAVVDGGLLNNVPANALFDQGCNFVVASTVTASLEKDFLSIRGKRSSAVSGFFPTLKVMMRQHMIQGYSMNDVGVQPADLVIAPDVTSFDLSEFTRADEMAVIGEAATNESIERLKAMLRKLDPQLFR